MSIVLPAEPLDEPPPALVLLLPLLLQPTTARATAAKAAIAGVRLIIFLSFEMNCPAATSTLTCRSGLHGSWSARSRCRSASVP